MKQAMKENSLLIFKDVKNEFTCYQMPINEANVETVNKIKAYIAEGFTKYGYEGYSFEVDKYFDPFSNFFYVEDKNGKIVATFRITKKTKDNILPFEMGIKDDGTSYKLEETVKVGDANSFVFSSYKALPLLFATTGRYAFQNGIKKGLCLLDDSSERIKKIYLTGGFKYSQKYNEKIFFPTFGRTEGKIFKPTYWSIMEIDHESIHKRSENADDFSRIST